MQPVQQPWERRFVCMWARVRSKPGCARIFRGHRRAPGSLVGCMDMVWGLQVRPHASIHLTAPWRSCLRLSPLLLPPALTPEGIAWQAGSHPPAHVCSFVSGPSLLLWPVYCVTAPNTVTRHLGCTVACHRDLRPTYTSVLRVLVTLSFLSSLEKRACRMLE